jgi:hypothetical protein
MTKLTLRQASLIAGFGYILMLGTPITEFLVWGKLVDFSNAQATTKNIADNLPFFRTGIMLYLVNFIGDIIAAWALYILLRPVSAMFSMLAAWLRIIYTILSVAALMNLLTILQLVRPEEYLNAIPAGQIQAEVMMALHAFRQGWSFCYSFFGLYLILLGWLVFISQYISRIVGACLIIAGVGWLTDSLQPYLFPGMKISIGMITGLGELVFMLWLFIKGSRLKEQD